MSGISQSEPNPPWRGILTLVPGAVVYRGSGGDADRHAHHAVQVMVSLDESFTVEFEDEVRESSAIVIPSGVSHRMLSRSRRLILMLIEPFGPLGRALSESARTSDSREAEDALLAAAKKYADATTATRMLTATTTALSQIGWNDDPKLSRSVQLAVQYLERSFDQRPTLAEAASSASISSSRLTHLFTQEIGMPFRRYALWVRLRIAVSRIIEGENLTQAAVAAGFSDSAHFSRVFKRNFGLPPSALTRMKVALESWPRVE